MIRAKLNLLYIFIIDHSLLSKNDFFFSFENKINFFFLNPGILDKTNNLIIVFFKSIIFIQQYIFYFCSAKIKAACEL